MNTKMLSQLEVMDTEMLAKVEGGGIAPLIVKMH